MRSHHMHVCRLSFSAHREIATLRNLIVSISLDMKGLFLWILGVPFGLIVLLYIFNIL